MKFIVGDMLGMYEDSGHAGKSSMSQWVRRLQVLFLSKPIFSENKKKIMVVCTRLDIGGTEKHLLQVLPRIDSEEFEVSICSIQTGSSLTSAFEGKNIKVYTPPFSLPYPLHVAISFVFMIYRYSVDRPMVVHFFLPEAYIIGGLAAVFAGVSKRMMSRRSLNRYQAAHPIGAFIESWLHKKMDIIVGNSEAVVAELIDEGVPLECLDLIYNGVDLKSYEFNYDRSSLRQQLSISMEKVVFICVANLHRHKGHHEIVEAFSKVEELMPNKCNILFIGRDVGFSGDLMDRVEELNLSNKVKWLGESADPRPFYAISDVAIMCSHEEGFSNSILEAMASSLPNIVTRVGGNAEAVRDGVNGIVVEAKDINAIAEAMIELTKERLLRVKMGKAGLKIISDKFSLEKCVASYEQNYRKLCRGKDRRAKTDPIQGVKS